MWPRPVLGLELPVADWARAHDVGYTDFTSLATHPAVHKLLGAEVARANSIQPAEYNDTPRSALGDPAVAAAVFGLAANQVSAPVQAGVGFVVAKVNSIQPGRAATLAEVREQVIAELRAEDARASVYRRVEAYEKARQDGKTLDVAVRDGRIKAGDVVIMAAMGGGFTWGACLLRV